MKQNRAYFIIEKIRDTYGKLSKITKSEFNTAYDKLQQEKELNGMSEEYWRIWNEEVCVAYRNLSERTPKILRSSQTEHILSDMNRIVDEREFF
jgi:hypothetical protein